VRIDFRLISKGAGNLCVIISASWKAVASRAVRTKLESLRRIITPVISINTNFIAVYQNANTIDMAAISEAWRIPIDPTQVGRA
jgi:phosphopantothenate synthetase